MDGWTDVISAGANVVTAVVAVVGGLWAYGQHRAAQAMKGQPLLHVHSVEKPVRSGSDQIWRVSLIATATDSNDWLRWARIGLDRSKKTEACLEADAYEYNTAGSSVLRPFDDMPFESYLLKVDVDFPFAPGKAGQISQVIFVRAPNGTVEVTLNAYFEPKGAGGHHKVPISIYLYD
ncbi:MAG: hypothetical protein P0Y65_20615 [Candidatus Devosia phytovorans]|uniref:Uncharacterized protein n=1 Tax=Candidatus Devosia phytovorans TaxID=3121372 RepID=A0AAJ5VUU9_9HYPH|nr:hypothetical protein [Devosia sp.]WEK04546.1 MAG: hypothetical protein P0Y65_20615 [Devosia sp.]